MASTVISAASRPVRLDIGPDQDKSSDTQSDPISKAYSAWKSAPEPEQLRQVVRQLDPVIKSALYRPGAGQTPETVYHRARLLAANAVRRYDPSKGAQLKTFVTQSLQGLGRMVPKIVDPFAPPERTRRTQAEIARNIEQFQNEHGVEPTDEELSELTKLPLKRIIKVRSRMRSRLPLSVYEDSDDDDDEKLDVVTSTRTDYDDWLDAVYHDLGDLDRRIFMHRTGFRNSPVMSNNEIAQVLGVSAAFISQRARIIQEKIDQWR